MLVNPLQVLHPNAAAPGDSSLVDSSRRAGFDKAAYAEWLQKLREVQRARHRAHLRRSFRRLPPRPRRRAGVLGVQADIVTYGKTLGGGLPVGAVCGKRALMRRFRDERPADICFARGTFNST